MLYETTLRKFRIFLAWQDEEEELWLRDMARAGWHLRSVQLPGLYTFEHGEPEDMVYRLDFTPLSRQEFLGYVRFFEDTGWEYVGEMNNWQYFRKRPRPGEDPQIYTDAESKIAKYRRVRNTMVTITPLAFLPIFLANIERYPTPVAIMFGTFFLLALVACASVFLKINARINQLKQL
jgi:hypothetical protein